MTKALDMALVPLEFDPRSIDQHIQLMMPWRGFTAFLEARGDDAATRVSYLDGALELMSPSLSHELIKKNLARLLEWWATEFDVELNGYGSATLKRASRRAGLEPDECYFVGARGGRSTPDLAVEVVWTRGLVDKLEIYRRLGVKEVWVYEQGVLASWSLRSGAYVKGKKSKLLPSLDLALLARFAGAEEQHAAVKAFKAALRSH
jgi:hypothetical protein